MAKNILFILVLFVIVIVLLWGWPGFLNKKTENNEQVSTTTEKTTSSGSQTQSQTTSPTKKTQTQIVNQSLSYTQAMNTYASGKRIQFDQNCLTSPTNINLKKGTKIMLDNRSNQVRPIYLDGTKYTLEAYGFKIVTITTTASLPHTMRVDCGTGKNNA